MSQANMELEYSQNVAQDGETNDLYPYKLNNVCSQKSSSQFSKRKCLQFRFLKSKGMPDVVYTGLPIGGKEASIEVVLVDGLTGAVVKSGSEASAEVELDVLQKEFDKTDMDDWTSEEYRSYILPRKGQKESLLRTTKIRLIKGRGSLSNIVFSHTRVPLRKIEVRLGARIVRTVDFCTGTSVREAISEPFTVKDRRGMNKKDYHPSLTDKVSRLRNIGKERSKKLQAEGIYTVKDLLDQHRKGPEKLKKILGRAMPAKKLQDAINQAEACEDHKINKLRFPCASNVPSRPTNSIKEKMDSLSQEELDPSKMVYNTYKAEASAMAVAPSKNPGEDVFPSLGINYDGTKITDLLDIAVYRPFNTLGPESMTDGFCEDEYRWGDVDNYTNITSSFCENEQPQSFDIFDLFQSTTFCPPADLRSAPPELQANDIPHCRTQTLRGWNLLFSLLKWLLSMRRRIVARKQSVLGIKRCL